MIYREAARKLKALGCVEIPRSGGGAHRKWMNPATNQSTVVPDHPGKDIKFGTLKAIVRQLSLKWSDFDAA